MLPTHPSEPDDVRLSVVIPAHQAAAVLSAQLDALLRRADVPTRPTYWHGMRREDPGAALNSVGTDLTAAQFWDRVDAGAFAAARWPVDLDGPLYLPAPPDWLRPVWTTAETFHRSHPAPSGTGSSTTSLPTPKPPPATRSYCSSTRSPTTSHQKSASLPCVSSKTRDTDQH